MAFLLHLPQEHIIISTASHAYSYYFYHLLFSLTKRKTHSTAIYVHRPTFTYGGLHIGFLIYKSLFPMQNV